MAMAQDRPQDGGKDFKAIRTPMSNKIRFGLAGGVNFAKLTIDNDKNLADSLDINGRATFHFGGLVNIPIGDNVSFIPGVYYSGQGGSIGNNRAAAVNEGDYDLALHYIDVPLVLNYRMPSGIYLEVGAQPGFLVGAKQKFTSGPLNEKEVDVKDAYDGFNVSALGGLGYMTRIGLGFGARYNFGLSNILEEGQAKDGRENKIRTIQVGLTYQFGAHK